MVQVLGGVHEALPTVAAVKRLQQVMLLLTVDGQLCSVAEALPTVRAKERGFLQEIGGDSINGRSDLVPLLDEEARRKRRGILRGLGGLAELLVLLAVVEEQGCVQKAFATHGAAVQGLLKAMLGLAVSH